MTLFAFSPMEKMSWIENFAFDKKPVMNELHNSNDNTAELEVKEVVLLEEDESKLQYKDGITSQHEMDLRNNSKYLKVAQSSL